MKIVQVDLDNSIGADKIMQIVAPSTNVYHHDVWFFLSGVELNELAGMMAKTINNALSIKNADKKEGANGYTNSVALHFLIKYMQTYIENRMPLTYKDHYGGEIIKAVRGLVELRGRMSQEIEDLIQQFEQKLY